MTANKTKIPKIPLQQMYKEIGKRANISADFARSIIEIYVEVVKECLSNKVMVTLPGVGTFRLKEVPPREHIEWYAYPAGRPAFIFYRNKVDGYIRPSWSFLKRFTDEIKERSVIPYGTAPCGQDVYETKHLTDTIEKIDYDEYKRNLNTLESIVEKDDLYQNHDEYDDITHEDVKIKKEEDSN